MASRGTGATPALTVRELYKRYGDLVAVNRVSFEVQRGEIFGLLGPNGAGKTTTLEILEGLRKPDGGEAIVAGVDAVRDSREVRRRIGVQLQEAGFFEKLSVRETLVLFASFHTESLPVDPLIDSLQLREKSGSLVESLSGGQRQRLSIALALLNDPEIVFLDEPTTGLDPQARRNLWEVIARIRDEGRTVVLTTHYMDEAEQLCDRIAIMDHSEVIALDSPSGLVRAYAPGAKVHLGVGEIPMQGGGLGALPAVDRLEETDDRGVVLHSTDPEETLPALFDYLREHDLDYRGLRIEGGTLEDVFLNLTGRRLRE